MRIPFGARFGLAALLLAGVAAAQDGKNDKLEIDRKADKVEGDKKIPSATKEERRDFVRIWELYRKNDRRWPLERDRFKTRSEGAGYLLAGHIMKYYMQVNAVRTKAGKRLLAVKNEVVAVGKPCVPALVNLMALDRIAVGGGRWFTPDDITRRDCMDMIERIGRVATPDLLKALKNKKLSVKGRRLTVLALGGTKDPRGLKVIGEHLKTHPSWQVRADAASALAKLGSPRGVPLLVDAIRNDKDKSVVKRAGKARQDLMASLVR